MGQHIQTVCTVTLGTCMKAQNLPSTSDVDKFKAHWE